jgi:hypothetical protein
MDGRRLIVDQEINCNLVILHRHTQLAGGLQKYFGVGFSFPYFQLIYQHRTRLVQIENRMLIRNS